MGSDGETATITIRKTVSMWYDDIVLTAKKQMSRSKQPVMICAVPKVEDDNESISRRTGQETDSSGV